MSKHIRTFESFQGGRRNIQINETVIQRDNSFIVGGVRVDKKTISAYAKKVKDQTGKDIKSMYSEMEIAEELVKWSVNSLDNIDNVPVSALMGGEEEMAQDLDDMDMDNDVDETGDLDLDTDDVDGEDPIDVDVDMEDEDSEDTDDGDLDLDLDTDLDDDFESPSDDEDTDDTDEDTDDTDDLDLDITDEDDGEDEDLPI